MRIGICKRVAVHREEEFRLWMCETHIHTRLQFPRSRTARMRDIHILCTCHNRTRTRRVQKVLHAHGNGKGDILLSHTRVPDRA